MSANPHLPPGFSPATEAFEAALAAVDVRAYERSRNHLDGRVTRLSPYITHGFTSIPQVFNRLQQEKQLTLEDKLAFEFGWREFFHHVWHRSGESIFQDMRAPLPGICYRADLPDDIRQARTGIAVIDRAVTTLYQTGYLHNHARMWLASYVVHLRKVHWRAGADWMYGHLLDGDLASNHLSWQWVAATFSNKPYLFNADNVARFAGTDWQSPQSAIDLSYEALDEIARTQTTLEPKAGIPPLTAGVPPLLTQAENQTGSVSIPPATRIKLIHPWMLDDAPFGGLRLGLIHLPFHQQFPWSAARWEFVLQRMRTVTDQIFIGNAQSLACLLTGAPSVESTATQNPHYCTVLPDLCTQLSDAPRQFPNPEKTCRSFSAFWAGCTGPAKTDANKRGRHRP